MIVELIYQSKRLTIRSAGIDHRHLPYFDAVRVSHSACFLSANPITLLGGVLGLLNKFHSGSTQSSHLLSRSIFVREVPL